MKISDEVFINSMNDISKYFQIILDNKDKRIADLQLQLDQAKSEITKHKILLNDMETENSHLETMLDQAKERLKGAIIPRYAIGAKLYMIPTEFNRLKGIKDYELLSISLSPIGLRYDLSLNKKEKGVEPFYCASEDMFGQSIFSTLEEAQAKLQELQNGDFSGE